MNILFIIYTISIIGMVLIFKFVDVKSYGDMFTNYDSKTNIATTKKGTKLYLSVYIKILLSLWLVLISPLFVTVSSIIYIKSILKYK